MEIGERLALPFLFEFWAHDHQLPPDGDWRTWVALGGRGAGKTRAGAEWVRSMVEGPRPLDKGRCKRLALVGETFDQVREVMVFGDSGIMACSPPDRKPKWVQGRRCLVWPNGAEAMCFSAYDPESLRGPQFDGAWADELAKWPKGRETWDMLQFGLRLTDFDTSALHGRVRGYITPEVTDARHAIQPLMLAYGFDAIERDSKVIFRMRDGMQPVDITPEDFAVSEEVDGGLSETRAGEVEMAGRVRVGFVQADADHQVPSEEAILPDERTHAVAETDLPLAMTRAEGRQTAERWLAEAGDTAVSWIRRTRIDGDPWELFEVPLGEDREAYLVRVMDGTAVVRETTVTSPEWTYTAAMQNADALGGVYTINVAQVSDRFGPGPFASIAQGAPALA